MSRIAVTLDHAEEILLGAFLRAARLRKGAPEARRIGQIAGIDPLAIEATESGRFMLSSASYARLLAYLDVDLGDGIGEAGERLLESAWQASGRAAGRLLGEPTLPPGHPWWTRLDRASVHAACLAGSAEVLGGG